MCSFAKEKTLKLSTKEKLFLICLPVASAVLFYAAVASQFDWWPF